MKLDMGMRAPRVTDKEFVILQLLSQNMEMYGLELVSSDARLKRGTVYVTLNRMSEKGYVSSRIKEAPGEQGPPRRVYMITGYGQKVLANEIRSNALFSGEAVA